MENTIFDEVWKRIISNEGVTFITKTGKEFSYTIKGEGLKTTRTDYRLSKTDFEKAYKMMPIDGPGIISDLVRGSAYIWAILNDKRIIT